MIDLADLLRKVRARREFVEPARRESSVGRAVSPHPVMDSSNVLRAQVPWRVQSAGRFQSLVTVSGTDRRRTYKTSRIVRSSRSGSDDNELHRVQCLAVAHYQLAERRRKVERD